MTFMVGGSFGGGFVGEVASELALRRADALGGSLMPWGSSLLAVLAAAVAARAWPTWRRPMNLVLCAVLVVLAWALPALGAGLLTLSICATTQRWRLAAAAAVAAAWIVGSCYYELQWPLATKAVVLVGAGVLLGAIGWLGRGASSVSRSTAAAPGVRGRGAMLIGLTAVATLAAVNVAIWQKEALIAEGRPVYVELAPVDPRSLMQGDYMRLNFRLPEDVERQLDALVTRQRPHVVARRDARGVASLLRAESPGAVVAADEFRIELTPKNGRWIFVSDAWFFREGDGPRWAVAKYGEFRVAADGRALLVGMADAALLPIKP